MAAQGTPLAVDAGIGDPVMADDTFVYLSCRVPMSLRTELRLQAVQEGRPLAQLVEDAVRAYLDAAAPNDDDLPRVEPTDRQHRPHYLYRHWDCSGVLLYVGRTCALTERTKEHRNHSRWWTFVERITTERCDDLAHAMSAERNAIHAEQPIFNRASRGVSEPGSLQQRQTESIYVSKAKTEAPVKARGGPDAGQRLSSMPRPACD